MLSFDNFFNIGVEKLTKKNISFKQLINKIPKLTRKSFIRDK